MPSSRTNATRSPLALDEESFQGLLAAAFTIQEHNDRRKQAQAPQAELNFEDDPHGRSSAVCPHCGATKPSSEARCPSCGWDELRPGERLQRNWASMWLMSQEQGLWREPSPETDDNHEATGPAGSSSHRGNGKPLLNQLPAETRSPLESAPTHNLASGFEDSALSEEPDPAHTYGESVSLEAVPATDISSDADDDSRALMRRLTDLRVTLRFHRADLYLGIAVFVAALALLWPAASAPRRPALSLFERALISLGIAEAPAPAVHAQGDPTIEVWVDPHTALYYCPGEDQYGKTTDGRFTSQREAQMDRFEPASRSACE